MKSVRLLAVAILLAGAVLCAGADGAGGTFLGYYVGEHPLVERLHIPSSGLDLMYFGGYGYGVGRHGTVNGGFGLTFLDTVGTSRVAGGIGGVIAGFRLLRLPLHVAIVSWTGVGGIYTGLVGPSPNRGFFVGFEEIDLEIGLPIARWFMPALYVGYQAMGNLIPGVPFQDSLIYSPVAGVRLAWGSFR